MLKPDDLDASWFQTALTPQYSGVRVSGAEITKVDEWTNTHVRMKLSFDEAAGAPERVFVKLPPRNVSKARAMGSARMGALEARFYQRLAPVIDLRVPTPHAAIIEEDGGFAIVIEDLRDSGCVPYNAIGVSPDAAAGALEDLAKMHVRYEDPGQRTGNEVSWIAAPAPRRAPDPQRPEKPNVGQILLRRGIDQARDQLNDAYVTVAEFWIDHVAELQALWWDAPHTVIQGDAHPGNLFDDHGRVGFLDWGIISLGDPMRDASYFICLALDTEVRRAHQRELLRHYLDVRRSLGGREIGWDDAWNRHRIHAAYTVPASCQALAVPEDATPNAKKFSALFLQRAVAAVEDLDAPNAIGAFPP
ncbi:MAG: phosphotransferase [Candidatus Binatia bacterium]|nr:phosphotransferase [Candidatus Binatia bacterium]